MNKFYINLDDSVERKTKFDNTWTRWSATGRNQVDIVTRKKMISYYNVSENYHLGKCGCFLSHIKLLKYIVENKLNDVLICEDDAIQVGDLPDYLGEGFVYLGGYFLNIKKTKGAFKGVHNSNAGLNTIVDKPYNVCMTLSYYIGTYQVAEALLNELLSNKRYRAIDIMYINSKLNKQYLYPALFVEEHVDSTIRKGKGKYSNEYYNLN